MRLGLALAATAMLVAAPLLAAVPDDRPKLWRWPNVPEVMPETVGSVSIVVQLRGTGQWVVVDTLTIEPPPEALSVCGPSQPEHAG